MAYTTIDNPTDYFNTVLYTGNGSTQNITGLDFQPDWIWYKNRGATNHNRLIDSVRGSNKNLASDLTNAENTDSTYVTSFNSDGWSIGSNTDVNASSASMVAWTWLAGGSASSNTDGTITSTVSANTTAGFSIVSYTGNGSAGATVGHGLGSAPAVMLFKIRNTADNWRVYHQGIDTTAPEDYHVQLNSTGARIDNAGFFNDTAPTSSVFTLGSDSGINGSSNTFITYCFAEKKGFSKFGSYTGNGSADGTFVYLGFKPAWVMVKKSSGVNAWLIHDVKRSTLNPMDNQLFANTTGAEDTTSTNDNFDFLSNGFKARNTGDAYNGSGGTYIYMAFAESPFVTSTGIPTTAR